MVSAGLFSSFRVLPAIVIVINKTIAMLCTTAIYAATSTATTFVAAINSIITTAIATSTFNIAIISIVHDEVLP